MGDQMTTRSNLEKLALRLDVRIDTLNDEAASRVILSRVPGVNANGSSTYIEAAINALAHGVGFSSTSRADATRTDDHVHLDDPSLDRTVPRADASIDELRKRTAAAHAQVRADAEGAWMRPIAFGAHAGELPRAAHAPEDKLTLQGTLAALAERTAAEHRAAGGVPGPVDAEAARRAMVERSANAWRGVPSIAAVAEEISARHRGSRS